MTLRTTNPVTVEVINTQVDNLIDAWEELKNYPLKGNFMQMNNAIAILIMNMPILQSVIEYDEIKRKEINV